MTLFVLEFQSQSKTFWKIEFFVYFFQKIDNPINSHNIVIKSNVNLILLSFTCLSTIAFCLKKIQKKLKYFEIFKKIEKSCFFLRKFSVAIDNLKQSRHFFKIFFYFVPVFLIFYDFCRLYSEYVNFLLITVKCDNIYLKWWEKLWKLNRCDTIWMIL